MVGHVLDRALSTAKEKDCLHVRMYWEDLCALYVSREHYRLQTKVRGNVEVSGEMK